VRWKGGWDQGWRFNDLGDALEMNQYFLCSVTSSSASRLILRWVSCWNKPRPAEWQAGCRDSVSKANTTYISDTRAVFALVNGSIESLLKLLHHPPSNGLFPHRAWSTSANRWRVPLVAQKWVRVVGGTAFRIPRERDACPLFCSSMAARKKFNAASLSAAAWNIWRRAPSFPSLKCCCIPRTATRMQPHDVAQF